MPDAERTTKDRRVLDARAAVLATAVLLGRDLATEEDFLRALDEYRNEVAAAVFTQTARVATDEHCFSLAADLRHLAERARRGR